jgi:uncharacterized membrane protein YeaQ/YmgE (transglycosylase-associated protein family)
MSLYILWAMVGICPEWWPPWPRRPRPLFPEPAPNPIPPRPGPGPDPPILNVALGVVGGLIGGYLFTRAFGEAGATLVDAASSSVGAFVGSVILNGIVAMVMNRRPAAGA